MDIKKITYWVSTGLLSAFCLLSAMGKLSQNPDVLTGFNHVAYPTSLSYLLGAMLIGAVAAILSNFNHDIKVAAYAGLVFFAIGIAYAHLAIGDGPASALPVASIILVLTLLSYFNWKRA